MSTILYGNLSVAVVDELGTLLDRPRALPAPADMLRPRRPEVPSLPPMLGRNRELADAFSAIHARHPVEFHAACGYGKTTLLQHIAATAGARGIALNCLYLRMDADRVDDLLHRLVTTLFSSARPVKLTQDECAQVLGPVRAIIAIDDLSGGPDRAGYLLDVLRGCDLVLGAARPVIGRRGTSRDLAGLPGATALALLADGLGRPLREEERPAARRLADAVDGQPLHLRQAAALVRDGGHSLESLARRADGDPDVLDRLSVTGLADVQRRALAVLVVVAGALVPADVVDAIDNIADLGECLDSLHRHGLIERHADRFGVPACKAASYRPMLLKYLGLAAAARELCGWLAGHDPSAGESGPAADAALSIIGFAADQGDWATVATLAKAAEAVLFLAGRWEAWKHVLARGLDAAKAMGDGAAEAFFSHQLGSLAFCRDDLDDALRLLQHALDLRAGLGDQDGADRTRHNLRLLQAPAPPPSPRPGGRSRRTTLTALAGVAGALVLAVATVAIAGTLHRGPSGTPGNGPGSTVTTTAAATLASASQSATVSPSATGSPSAATATASQSATGTVSPTQSPTTSNSVSQSATASSSASQSATVIPTTEILNSVLTETQGAAVLALQGQQLTASIGTADLKTSICAGSREGTVGYQYPSAGAIVDLGSAVTILVCNDNPDITVANVVGQPAGPATAILTNQGLAPASIPTSDCPQTDEGNVTSQNPVGDSVYKTGEPITSTITVCEVAAATSGRNRLIAAVAPNTRTADRCPPRVVGNDPPSSKTRPTRPGEVRASRAGQDQLSDGLGLDGLGNGLDRSHDRLNGKRDDPAERHRPESDDHHAEAGEEPDLLRDLHDHGGTGRNPAERDVVVPQRAEHGAAHKPGPGRRGQRRAEHRGLPGAGDNEQNTADEDRGTRQDLQPQPRRGVGPGGVRRVGIVEIRPDEGDQGAPQPEQDQQSSAGDPATPAHTQDFEHRYHFPTLRLVFTFCECSLPSLPAIFQRFSSMSPLLTVTTLKQQGTARSPRVPSIRFIEPKTPPPESGRRDGSGAGRSPPCMDVAATLREEHGCHIHAGPGPPREDNSKRRQRG
jgi:hypothetical protein